jgi:hypothetical protein
MLARDLLHGRHGELLHRVTVLVVPLFNADDNDRIDTNNRKLDLEKLSRQIGPTSEVGTRGERRRPQSRNCCRIAGTPQIGGAT